VNSDWSAVNFGFLILFDLSKFQKMVLSFGYVIGLNAKAQRH
jgi:hypothetical protein